MYPDNDKKFYETVSNLEENSLRKHLDDERKNYCLFSDFSKKFSSKHYEQEKHKTRKRIEFLEQKLGII